MFPSARDWEGIGKLGTLVIVAQLRLALGSPMDRSPPGSSVPGILQARILEWVAMPSYRGSSRPRDQTHVSYSSCIANRFFTAEPLGKPSEWALLVKDTVRTSLVVQWKRIHLPIQRTWV